MNADRHQNLQPFAAFLLPPLSVGLKRGIGGSFVFNVILAILLYLPDLIHALIVVLCPVHESATGTPKNK